MTDVRNGLSGEALGLATFELAKQNLEGISSERICSMSADDLAILAKVSRSALYQNNYLRSWLETEHRRIIKRKRAKTEAPEETVTKAPKVERDDRLLQQISDLQTQNAKLKAEQAELRSRLVRYKHIDEHLARTGRLAR